MMCICYLSTPQSDGWEAYCLNACIPTPVCFTDVLGFSISLYTVTRSIWVKRVKWQRENVSLASCTFCKKKTPTCCPPVFANSEFELLLDWCDLKVVIYSINSLWAQTQVKPQLILSWSIGELIYLVQTWRNRQTESVKREETIHYHSYVHVSSACRKPWKTCLLTNPELIFFVAKTFDVLSPSFHEVQLASGTTLEHLKGVRSGLSLTHLTQIIETGLQNKHYCKESITFFKIFSK